MKFIPSEVFPEVIIVEPDAYKDDRGYFLEMYHELSYGKHGMPARFVQDNVSFSTKGVLRGLHYQLMKPQGKLIMVISGEIFDVAVDVRRGSPTFGKSLNIHLSSRNSRQLYIPKGFAHGFCVLSEAAYVYYKCTEYYDPSSERGLVWNDPSLAIQWPFKEPVLSAKDKSYPVLDHIPEEDLPKYIQTKKQNQ